MYSEKCHLPTCRRLVAIVQGKVFANGGNQLPDVCVIRSAQCLRVEKIGTVAGLADDTGLGPVFDVADQRIFLVLLPFFGPVEFILDLHGEAEDVDLKAGVLLEVFGDHGVSV